MPDYPGKPLGPLEAPAVHEFILGHELYEAFDCASGRRITGDLVADGDALEEAPMLSVLFPGWRNNQRRFVSSGTLTVAGWLAEDRLRAEANKPLAESILGAWASVIGSTEPLIVVQTPELTAVGVLRFVAAFHSQDDAPGTLALVRLVNLFLPDTLPGSHAAVSKVQAKARTFLRSIDHSRDIQAIHVESSAVVRDTQGEGPSRLSSEPEDLNMKAEQSDDFLLFDTVKTFREIRDCYRLNKLATALRLNIPLRHELNVGEAEKLVNRLCGKSFGSLAANQIAAQEIQGFLVDLGLRIACPKAGCLKAATLQCTPGTRMKHGMFVFVHPDQSGQAHHGGLAKLPEKISLLPASVQSKRGASRTSRRK